MKDGNGWVFMFILVQVFAAGVLLWVFVGALKGDVGRLIQGGFMIGAALVILRAFAPLSLSDEDSEEDPVQGRNRESSVSSDKD